MHLIRCFSLILLMSITACDRPWVWIKAPADMPVIRADMTMVAAWVPFSSLDLSAYDITGADKTMDTEERLNKAVYQQGLRKYMKDRTILFAVSPRSGFPKEGDILIRIKPLRIEKKWDFRQGGTDLLYADIELISIPDKKTLYTASLAATSLGAFHHDLMSRLRRETHNLSRCVAGLLTAKEENGR